MNSHAPRRLLHAAEACPPERARRGNGCRPGGRRRTRCAPTAAWLPVTAAAQEVPCRSGRGSAAYHGRGPGDEPGRPARPGGGARGCPHPVPGDLPADDGQPADDGSRSRGGGAGRPGALRGAHRRPEPGHAVAAARLSEAGRSAGELVPAHRQPGRDRADLAVLQHLVSARRRGQPARDGLADRQTAELRHRPSRRPDLPRRGGAGALPRGGLAQRRRGLRSRLRCAVSSAPRATPISATPTRAPRQRPKRSARSPG